MKKALALLVMGVLATTANASIVYMEFDGGATAMDAAPSDMVTVHIFLDVFDAGTLPAEEVGAFQATFLEELALWQMDTMVLPDGWEDDSSDPGPLDQLTQQVNWARSPTGSIVGPGIHEIGTVTLHVADDAEMGSTAELAFWPEFSFPRNPAGGAQTYNPDLAAIRFGGYYDFGTGGPDAPLTIGIIPEPASFALLALGGLAALRRR